MKDHVTPSTSQPERTTPGVDGAARPQALEHVVERGESSSIFEMQTGLWRLGHHRAHLSGTTEPLAPDVQALEDHARAMAKDTYRDRYDPEANPHDAMHHTEYLRTLARREEAEKGEQHAEANLRDAEHAVAEAPKAGPKPSPRPILVAAFVVALALSIAPTLHDSVFHTIPDDLLAWFASLVGAGFMAGMVTLAILGGRRTRITWIGVAAGVILGVGLGAVRLSSASGAAEVLFALGLTIVEIAVVLLLEWLAVSLRASEAEWLPRHEAESRALAARDMAAADLDRWKARLKAINDAISAKIAFVEDRHNRNMHIGELETVAIKAVLDGYNAAIAENIGRIRGVAGRAK